MSNLVYLRDLRATRPVSRRLSLRALCARLLAWMSACHERSVSRDYLREMDARMLSDIGITRVEAAMEARKPWWCP